MLFQIERPLDYFLFSIATASQESGRAVIPFRVTTVARFLTLFQAYYKQVIEPRPSYSFYYIIIAILYFYFIWAWVKGREELRPEAEEDSALRSPLLFTQAPYGTAPSFLFSLSHLPLARPLPVWPVKGMKEREGREWHVDLWPFKKSNERIVATDPNVFIPQGHNLL